MQAVTDEQLIHWVAAGDASCLGTLFERHHRAVYQFCLQMTRNPAQAEDVVQEVFLKLLRKAGGFRGEGSFRAWMFNIARNATLDHLRKQKRDANSVDVSAIADHVLVDNRSAEQAAGGQESLGTLEQALARLPAHFQEIIWLGRFEFNSFEELAQALGCKTGTARVRMHRAMQQLQAAFNELNGVTDHA
jgi:RNA polymerase sigma-70 factor (ECF subfamily)